MTVVTPQASSDVDVLTAVTIVHRIEHSNGKHLLKHLPIIQTETLLLKYLFENGLPKTNHTNRTSILNKIKSLSYYQTFLSSSEFKDYFQLIKKSD
ncbi:unnamed protein product [Rotaria sordida]|uniref:Uncharacterized protein n=1 Tax=Rotaria sordida TaxID=392033 RepID=A0A815ICP3_9BILA|nr:unnamed protein product [Rotaria sordida]CAF3869371.1 unnamed protein product [Rotaria sordida]